MRLLPLGYSEQRNAPHRGAFRRRRSPAPNFVEKKKQKAKKKKILPMTKKRGNCGYRAIQERERASEVEASGTSEKVRWGDGASFW